MIGKKILVDYEKCRNNHYDTSDIIITNHQKDFRVKRDALVGMPTCYSLDKRLEEIDYHRFLSGDSISDKMNNGSNNNNYDNAEKMNFLFKKSNYTIRRRMQQQHRRRHSCVPNLPSMDTNNNLPTTKPKIIVRKRSKSMDFILSMTKRCSINDDGRNKKRRPSVIKQMFGKRRKRRHSYYLNGRDDNCCRTTKKSYLFYDSSITDRDFSVLLLRTSLKGKKIDG